MSGRLPRLRGGFRQRRYRRAFRIAPVPVDPLLEFLERLPAQEATRAEETQETRSHEPDGEPDPAAGEKPEPGLDEKILVDAVTNLWRAQRKLGPAEKGESSHTRHTRRYLRTCSEMLTDAGLSVQDHDGREFHSGLSLEVVTFEEDPALAAETILETIRPSIYLHARHIQMGQVIVGYPPRQSESAEPESAEPESAGEVRNDHE